MTDLGRKGKRATPPTSGLGLELVPRPPDITPMAENRRPGTRYPRRTTGGAPKIFVGNISYKVSKQPCSSLASMPAELYCFKLSTV